MTNAFTTARRTAKSLTLTAFAATALTFAIGLSAGSTAEASSPKACIDQVMHGGVNWGKGTNWQYKNAAALCKGAVDYTARIGCFTTRVQKGEHWNHAIQNCQKVGAQYDPYGDTPKLNGQNVGMVEYAHGRFEMHDYGWVELDAYGYELDRYTETHRDTWTVDLYDQNRDVYVTLDLYNSEIIYEGYTRYEIIRGDYATPKAPARPSDYGYDAPKPKGYGNSHSGGYDAPKPKGHDQHSGGYGKRHSQLYNVKAGPLRDTYHAKQTCPAIAKQYNATWTGHWETTVPGKMSVCRIKI